MRDDGGDDRRTQARASCSRWLLAFLKKTAAAHFANFVLAVLVLIKPVSNALGPKAFLVITYLHLFFYPCTTIGEHLETVLLGVVGLSIGLALSFLAVAGAIWTGRRHDEQPSVGTVAVYDNSYSRAVGACVLVALAFLGGLLSSSTPRLKASVRIALFASTWTITVPPAATTGIIDFGIFSDQFYPALLAAGVSVLANVAVLPRTAHDVFASALVSTLESIDAVLDRSLADFFAGPRANERVASEELIKLRRELLLKASKLTESYGQAMLEVSFARLPLVELRPMLSIIARTRGWISCGMGLSTRGERRPPSCVSPVPQSEEEGEGEGEKKGDSQAQTEAANHNDDAEHVHAASADQFQPCLTSLTHQIGVSLRVVRACLELTLASQLPKRIHPTDSKAVLFVLDPAELGSDPSSAFILAGPDMPARAVLAQRKRLEVSIDGFKIELANAMDTLRAKSMRRRRRRRHEQQQPSRANAEEEFTIGADAEAKAETEAEAESDVVEAETLFRSDIYDIAFFMVGLLEISIDAAAMLRHSQRILTRWHAQRRRRVWWPLLSWSQWSGRAQRGKTLVHDDAIFDDTETRYGYDRAHMHFDESHPWALQGDMPSEQTVHQREGDRPSDPAGKAIEMWTVHAMAQSFVSFSHRQRVLAIRIALARAMRSVRHSRHIRYATKLAFGVALLSLPAWLPSGQQWYESQRGVWLIVTYIWVLETSTGATIRMSLFRTIGTISGAVYGLVAWYISGQGNRYALAFLLALAEVPASYFIVATSKAQPIGIVFALTQSVVVLIPLGGELDEQSSVAKLALVRGYQILLGIAAAFLVNTFIWPLHARVYLIQAIARITSQSASLYLSLARQMIRAGRPSPESTARFEHLEEETQTRLSLSRRLLDEMRSEISLVPKATPTLSCILKSLQTIVDLLVALRQCRETGMRAIRTEAVFNVLDLRRDLVSAVLLTLWIVGQALRTSAPLPQFLPSPRLALEDLTQAMKEQVESSSTPPHQRSRSRPSKSPGGSWTPNSRTGHDADRALDVTIAAATRRLLQRQREHQQQGREGKRKAAVDIDYAYFFVFAEHALLAGIITELEALLISTRHLVGESSFILSGYLPRLEADTSEAQAVDSTWQTNEMHARNQSLSQMQKDLAAVAGGR